MGLGLTATDKVGKSESIESRAKALLVCILVLGKLKETHIKHEENA